MGRSDEDDGREEGCLLFLAPLTAKLVPHVRPLRILGQPAQSSRPVLTSLYLLEVQAFLHSEATHAENATVIA